MAKYETPNRVVIALGGNALGNTPEEQIENEADQDGYVCQHVVPPPSVSI